MRSLFLRVICSVSEGGAHLASTTDKAHQLSPLSLPTCQVLLGCLASFCQVLVRLNQLKRPLQDHSVCGHIKLDIIALAQFSNQPQMET